MLRRCENEKNVHFHNYGGRGVRVCSRWKIFENFMEDMGESPEGLELDRIDNQGHYEPKNCRWVTRKENCGNRRSRWRDPSLDAPVTPFIE
jgi:hypothetical protein